MLAVASKLLFNKGLASVSASSAASSSSTASSSHQAPNGLANTLQATGPSSPNAPSGLANFLQAYNSFVHIVPSVGNYSRMLDGWDKYPAPLKRLGGEWPGHGEPRRQEPSSQGPGQAPDASTLLELWRLDQTRGPIGGDRMAKALEWAVGGSEGQAAAKALEQFARWGQSNAHRLSPEARQALDSYENHTRAARGQSSLSSPVSPKLKRGPTEATRPMMTVASLRMHVIMG